MRGPSPRLYVPSMGIQALTRFRDSNINWRSTARSRTTGNFVIGSRRMGCSRLSTRAEQAILTLPLMTIAHDPQTSSRQFDSYETGVVFLPSRVTGFSAISRRQMIAFIDGRHLSANSSQCEGCFGPAWRLTRTMTCFSLMECSFRSVVLADARWNQGYIHRLVRKLNLPVAPLGAGRFQPVRVIAIWKIGLVVCAARFVARQSAESDNAREQQHVFEFAGEIERLVGPSRAIAQIDAPEAVLQFAKLVVSRFEIPVDARHRDVFGHDLAHLFPDGEGIFGALVRNQRLVLSFLALALTIKHRCIRRVRAFFQIFGVLNCCGTSDTATENAGDK